MEDTKDGNTMEYPFFVVPKLAFNRNAFFVLHIILFVVSWYGKISTRGIINIVAKVFNLVASISFYCVSFGYQSDSNQIFPLNILLFDSEITRVILRGIYSRTFF